MGSCLAAGNPGATGPRSPPPFCSRLPQCATWSSYQAARWNGEQAKTAARINKTRIEAARASGLANAQRQIDVATFMQWVDSYAGGRARPSATGSAFARSSMAFDAWLATKPLKTEAPHWRPSRCRNIGSPPGPRPEQLDQAAEVLAAQVRQYIQRASNYVLGVVLFAVALFFAR